VGTEIIHAKWLVWDGKEFHTPWWKLNAIIEYLRRNAHTWVNYDARHRNSLPISGSIAESAVTEVVSHRTGKKQQMRWT
jgi:hypothetical protein